MTEPLHIVLQPKAQALLREWYGALAEEHPDEVVDGPEAMAALLLTERPDLIPEGMTETEVVALLAISGEVLSAFMREVGLGRN